jgi:hypothetical protein
VALSAEVHVILPQSRSGGGRVKGKAPVDEVVEAVDGSLGDAEGESGSVKTITMQLSRSSSRKLRCSEAAMLAAPTLIVCLPDQICEAACDQRVF